jgi:hypothetical protein
MCSFPVRIPNTLRRLSVVAKIWADRESFLPAPTLCIAADGLARFTSNVPAQYRCIVSSHIEHVTQERCSVGCLVILTNKFWRRGMFSLAQASARCPLCSIDRPPRA